MNKHKTMKSKKHKSLALSIVQKYHPQVTKVVDANKPITINVTKSDANKSIKKDHKECAMAVACKRQEHADGAIISVRSAYVVKGKKAIRYRVPDSVAREVVSFDRSGGFFTGSYRLVPHRESDKIGRYVSGSKKVRVGPPKFIRHVTTNVRTSLISK